MSEAVKLGLPSRCPLSPFEPIVWTEFPDLDLSDSDDLEDTMDVAA
jgi:hypothetical protein